MKQKALARVEYSSPSANSVPVHLTGYADTIVLDPGRKWLIGIRFGGYAEMANALSAAIYAGADFKIFMGDDHLEVLSESKRLKSSVSSSGNYTLCTLLPDESLQEKSEKKRTASDDDSDKDSEAAKQAEAEQLHKVYLFCEPGNLHALYEELDRKTVIPMIPAFAEYFIGELQARAMLRKCSVWTLGEPFEVWELQHRADSKDLAEVLETGLKSGKIEIPGAKPGEMVFARISGMSSYLKEFGSVIAERIRGQFSPLFDPAAEPLSESVLNTNETIFQQTGYHLYNAQLAAAEALKRTLRQSKFAMLIAECGVGKSKIGLTALESWRVEQGGSVHFNLILCPSHITEKWVREIGETLPDALAAVVRTPSDIEELYALHQETGQSAYAVISKETARDGYMRRPAARWNPIKKGFVCPDCGEVVMMKETICGESKIVPANALFFLNENRMNHKCAECGAMLWTAADRAEQCEWVKIGLYGFVHRRFAQRYPHLHKNPHGEEELRKLAEDPNRFTVIKGAQRRVSLSEYIKARFQGRIDGLIADELHQYAANSGQGDAMGELYATARKCIGMTATLINGYSSGIFYLLYRTLPAKMLLDGKSFRDITPFNREYGVFENEYEVIFPEYNAKKRTIHRNRRERLRPGVSPLVYSRFLLERSVFLSLFDMGKELPEYEEIPVPLNLPNDVYTGYCGIMDAFKNICQTNLKIVTKVQSDFLNLLIAFPDQPYGHKPIFDPEMHGNVLYEPPEIVTAEPNAKDLYTIDLVFQKVENDEKCLIYVNWTRLETRERLKQLLTGQGIHAEIMQETIQPSKREDWIKKRLQEGLQVLIVNPQCVETGLDLNAFTTLIFYDMGYKLFTFRQASRRSWRINQTAPRVEVYLLYFRDTMQERAITLMATKLAVAGTIEGTNFSDEGLAAMGNCEDLSTVMARELTAGIREETVDVRDAFRKMANLHPIQLGNVSDSHEKAENALIPAAQAAEPIEFPTIQAFDEIWQSLTENPTEQVSLWELAG